MDTLMNNSLLEDDGQSLHRMIDEREQLIEDTIELEKQKEVEEAEMAKNKKREQKEQQK
jgi:hypothetical protein